jgi:putative transposase
MLKAEVNVPELIEFAKTLPLKKEEIFGHLEVNVKQFATDFLNGMMRAEFELFMGRESYERTALKGKRKNYRNGTYERSYALKGIGGVKVRVPRDRSGEYKTQVLPRYQRIDERIKQDAVLMYLLGESTRSVSLISERLLGRKISHSQVSEHCKELTENVEAWRTRSIEESIKYLYLDGTNFEMRMGGKIEKICVLAVIGVDENNLKKVLALQAGDKESAHTWRQLFKDLKNRGLSKEKIQLGIMDGLPGLEKVFLEEFSEAKVQRCQVHIARNVLCKVPHTLKENVADDLRSIFYASSKKKSDQFYKEFKERWQKELPSAVSCLERSIDSGRTFYKFPQDEWIAIRTTNVIERLNKEFKRRTKPMEIVAGEASCYNLLAVIALRMESHWRKNPIHFQKRLPWFKSPKENLHN